MSRKLAFAATVAVAVFAAAAPAQAGLFGKSKKDAPAETTAKAPAGKTAPAAAAAAPRKASKEERAQADRLDPLARAAFWGSVFDADPQDGEAGVKLSAALRAMERYPEAAAAADRVLVTDPGNVEAMLELGRAHIGRGQGFYAIDPLKKAMAAAPKDWRAPSLLGVAYEQVSRHDDAVVVWKEALKLSPENPAVLTNLALSYAANGNAAQAETLLRQAVARPGASLQTRQNLALVLGLQGKTAEAERLIREDLPPEQAEKNLAWLRAKTAAPAPASTGRTWNSLQGG
ncbi:tetratricopeptide repeat protein [Caulobacter sp. 17J80-11]|uniref:tetratricopeptide repeat protein n=1 Tax=Caulobacter sp. 17J80-11 TaxID=2763502 RepID=UPI0016537E65|nr:tetratricopeptide repeat protein [Caulobacter sp. 17J80-11]MBC6982515.1 tetratricopeptide repeat protein [Caulobacter sp. 17J80-11]